MNVIPVGAEPPPLTEPPTAEPPPKGPRDKAAGRFAVLNNFVDFSLADLSRTEIAAWLALYRDTRDGTARTAMADIARRAGCSRRQVVRAVNQLEARGLLTVAYRGGMHGGASRYRVRGLPKDE